MPSGSYSRVQVSSPTYGGRHNANRIRINTTDRVRLVVVVVVVVGRRGARSDGRHRRGARSRRPVGATRQRRHGKGGDFFKCFSFSSFEWLAPFWALEKWGKRTIDITIIIIIIIMIAKNMCEWSLASVCSLF